MKSRMISALSALALVAVATIGPAASAGALSPDCSLTALTPYKSGSNIAYGGQINCSTPIAMALYSHLQRQTTLSWTNISHGYSDNYSGVTKIERTLTNGACTPAGSSTFRSRIQGFDQTGNGWKNGSGRLLKCT